MEKGFQHCSLATVVREIMPSRVAGIGVHFFVSHTLRSVLQIATCTS